jgi:HEAT repeat protein
MKVLEGTERLLPRLMAKIEELQQPRPIEQVLAEDEGTGTRYYATTEDGRAVSLSRSGKDAGWFRLASELAWSLCHIDFRKTPQAVPTLIRILDLFPKPAAYALGEIGDAAAVPALMRGLHDSKGNPSKAHIAALGKLRAGEAVPHLINLLDEQPNKEPDVTKVCVVALGDIGDTRAAPILKRLAESRELDADVRGIARVSFIRTDSEDAGAGLLGLLSEEPTMAVKKAILAALGRMQERRAVRPLAALCRSRDDWPLVSCCIRALGAIGSREAVKELIELLSFETNVDGKAGYALREVVAETLAKSTGHDYGPDPEVWRYWVRER